MSFQFDSKCMDRHPSPFCTLGNDFLHPHESLPHRLPLAFSLNRNRPQQCQSHKQDRTKPFQVIPLLGWERGHEVNTNKDERMEPPEGERVFLKRSLIGALQAPHGFGDLRLRSQQSLHLGNRIHDGRVISTAKFPSNLRERCVCVFATQVHGNHSGQ